MRRPQLFHLVYEHVSGLSLENANAYIFGLALLSIVGGFFVGRGLAKRRCLTPDEGRSPEIHSLPNYHGYFTAWLIGAPVVCVLFAAAVFRGYVSSTALLAFIVAVAAIATALSVRWIGPQFRARVYVERFVKGALLLCSGIAILTTFGIVLSLLFESLRFFDKIPLLDFLTGLQWSPQTALRADQVGQSGAFGAVPIFAGTFLIMAVAICVSGPVGLMIAIYMSEYAGKRVRGLVKPAIEILAGVPTVIYGFFALLTVGPAIRGLAESLGFSTPTQSALAAGSVMGIMIIPFISSLSDDVINAVPQSLRDGSFALGATKSETVVHVIFASALPGIVGAFLLAISRAIGETMIVVMAAGRAANLTANPFEAVTTVTVQIVALLTGDQEFDSPKTLAAFALGLVLFAITLCLNILALVIVRRYRARYE